MIASASNFTQRYFMYLMTPARDPKQFFVLITMWELCGSSVGALWEASGKHLEAFGKHLKASGGIWEASESIWEASGSIWEASGSIWLGWAGWTGLGLLVWAGFPDKLPPDEASCGVVLCVVARMSEHCSGQTNVSRFEKALHVTCCVMLCRR